MRSTSSVRRPASFVIFATLLLVGTASAQEYSEMHGTWINGRFIEVLKRTASVASAMEAVPSNVAMWISIDTTDKDGNIDMAYDFDDVRQMLLLKSQLVGPELQWGIGDAVGPMWLVTVDQQQMFIALHDLDSLENKPLVFGRMPSKNQDPDFLLDRMINASILAGTYTDPKKNTVEFRTDLTATWANKPYAVKIDVKGSSHELHITLTSADAKDVRTYLVVRTGTSLMLTTPNGKSTTLVRR
jgi:hypothetical protein